MRKTLLIALLLTLSANTYAESVVNVMLQEWRIVTDTHKVPAGTVKISVQNRGQEAHEIVLLRSDIKYDSFPLHPKGGIDEHQAGVVINELEGLESRSRKEMLVNLKPGNYVLLCNMVEIEDGEKEQHYSLGMRAPLIVY